MDFQEHCNFQILSSWKRVSWNSKVTLAKIAEESSHMNVIGVGLDGFDSHCS